MATKLNFSHLPRPQVRIASADAGLSGNTEYKLRKETEEKAIDSAQRGVDGILNEYRLFRMFRRFDLRIDFVPQADVLQEIRTAMIASAECSINGKVETAYTQDTVRAVMRAIHCLLFNYGYSRNPRNAKPLRRGGKEYRFAADAGGNEYAVVDSHCICGYGSVMPELCECGLAEQEITLLQRMERLRETHSVKSICNLLGVKPSRKIEKAFNKCFPQHAGGGRGGKRNIYRRKTQE